jgi:hypothetical protein
VQRFGDYNSLRCTLAAAFIDYFLTGSAPGRNNAKILSRKNFQTCPKSAFLIWPGPGNWRRAFAVYADKLSFSLKIKVCGMLPLDPGGHCESFFSHA